MTFPTDAEREATERAIRSWTLDDAECIETLVDTILNALAPLVADRERAAAARALHDAADELERLIDDQHPAALNPDQWLRDRADELEAGEDRG